MGASAFGAHHAAACAGALRKAQGAHLSANGFALAARGLPRAPSRRRWQVLQDRTLGAHRPQGVEQTVGPAQQADLQQREGLRPLCDRADGRAAEAPERARGRSSTTSSSSASSRCFIRAAQFRGHDTDHARRRASRSSPRARCIVDPRLARGLRQGGAGRGRSGQGWREGNARPDQARRERRDRSCRVKSPRPPSRPRVCQRSDAALGHGRRGQAGRRRRASRSDAREGSRHAGDARADHRRPDLRSGTSTARAASSFPPPRRFR